MDATGKKQMPSGYKCQDCGWCGSSFRVSCPECGADGMLEVKASSTGTVVDYVTVFYPPENLKDLGQYTSVLVEFDEGFKKFGISLEAPEDFSIGCQVAVSDYDAATNRLMLEIVRQIDD